MLFPNNDEIIKLIALNRKKLDAWYLNSVPDWEIVKKFYYKNNAYEIADKLSIPIPRIYGGKNISEGRDYLKQNHIPCYHFPDRAAHSLKTLIKRREYLNSIPIENLEIPSFNVNKKKAEEIFSNVRKDGRMVLLSYETSEIFL